jgi:hypothetical protein
LFVLSGNLGYVFYEGKSNICVVCGVSSSLLRHNIIPHMFRKHLPEYIKSHSSHDIVLLCVPCHKKAEKGTETMRKKYIKLVNKK